MTTREQILEGALRTLMRGYVRLLENGRERILDLGGQCDPVDKMEAADSCLREARNALAYVVPEAASRQCLPENVPKSLTSVHGVPASGLPAWVDGLRDFMERNGKTTEEVGNVLVAAGFATRGVKEVDHG